MISYNHIMIIWIHMYMNSYVFIYEFIWTMYSYDFFIYGFICFMNSYVNFGVPRFHMVARSQSSRTPVAARPGLGWARRSCRGSRCLPWPPPCLWDWSVARHRARTAWLWLAGPLEKDGGNIYSAPEVLEITNRCNKNDRVSKRVHELAFGWLVPQTPVPAPPGPSGRHHDIPVA